MTASASFPDKTDAMISSCPFLKVSYPKYVFKISAAFILILLYNLPS
jgi:hypothetical protein